LANSLFHRVNEIVRKADLTVDVKGEAFRPRGCGRLCEPAQLQYRGCPHFRWQQLESVNANSDKFTIEYSSGRTTRPPPFSCPITRSIIFRRLAITISDPPSQRRLDVLLVDGQHHHQQPCRDRGLGAAQTWVKYCIEKNASGKFASTGIGRRRQHAGK
jgi:hypothetical protein